MMNKKRVLAFGALFMLLGSLNLQSSGISSVASMDQNTESEVYKYLGDGNREYYAVICGIVTYETGSEEWPTPFNANDVFGMYAKLLEAEDWWHTENMRVLLNDSATKANILDNISWLSEKADRDDVVLFYFTGWGSHQGSEAYIRPYDAKYVDGEYDYAGMLSETELADAFNKVESKHVVIIFDCCWSGKMNKLAQKGGRAVLAAGGKYFMCMADEDPLLKHGIFTFYLLQGLTGMADALYMGNRDGIVSAEEAFRFARPRTILHSFWYHLKKPKELPWPQIPTMYDSCAGEISLIYL